MAIQQGEPCGYFNPRAPYGARHVANAIREGREFISIHAPHTGRDVISLSYRGGKVGFQSTRPIRGATRLPSQRLLKAYHRFQSTRPIRGATQFYNLLLSNIRISIHAPHTGRDWLMVPGILYTWDFQSTRPIRGATWHESLLPYLPRISIHAPHTGRDNVINPTSPTTGDFNPRAPYGARHS